MDPRAVFGLSVLMNFVGAGVAAALYAWPSLKEMERGRALQWLVAPHLLIRFLGLSFLVPGVVSPLLPRGLAVPAAFGDLLAGVLAIVAVIGLAKRSSWAMAAVWVFNIWGAVDLINAFVEGGRHQVNPGAFGAGYFIVTTVAPMALTIHFLIFRVLVRQETVSRVPQGWKPIHS